VSRRPAIVAVDGGGSKIDAALLRRDGTVLGAARMRSSEYDENGGDQHLSQIVAAVEAAQADAGIRPGPRPAADLGVYCLAGADLPQDDRKIARWLMRRGIASTELVRNDTFAVLRAGTDRRWGVGVVCGYGTNCSGVAPDGRVTRFPAVGEISGDWGGGADLGRMAAWSAVRAEDGRGAQTSLRRSVPAHFGFRRPRQLMEAIYFDRVDPGRLVELAPLVFNADKEGDAVARGIVDRQALEIVLMAGTAIKRLRMTKLDVHVVLGGGLFRTDDRRFFERIEEGLTAVAPSAQIKILTAPPVIGAAMLGLDLLEAGPAAHARARHTLTHERLSGKTHTRRKD
jgi:N-acetylglucosamine kinase-like BadF-type ATPase